MYRSSSQLDVASSTEVMSVREPGAGGVSKGERLGGMGVGIEKDGETNRPKALNQIQMLHMHTPSQYAMLDRFLQRIWPKSALSPSDMSIC